MISLSLFTCYEADMTLNHLKLILVVFLRQDVSFAGVPIPESTMLSESETPFFLFCSGVLSLEHFR